MTTTDDRVSRKRYEREKRAREEAELLLEEKSRALYFANQQLNKHAETLDKAVRDRTAELRIALEEARNASAMRARFVATMSHEIRTPLGGLLGMIDLLKGTETDPEKLDLLTYAHTSGEALKRIVNDVLDFSKMEAIAFHFETENVDLRALVESILALARTVVPDGFKRLESRISDSVPKRFSGDGTRIRQVIANFVSNAGRYSSQGKIIVEASAKPHEKGALLRVSVTDQGVGISAEQQENLFKDFVQVQNRLTAAAQGTGLGLAISKRIVEGCGGVIGVDSTEGVGSTFWFELPVEVLPDTESAEMQRADALPRPSSDELTGRRVLLAEDNRINQKLILAYLKRLDLVADLAENGRVAVEKFAPGRYDLILMDVAMPEMDGFEAIRNIHATWPAEAIPPIIVLTAHVMEAVREENATVGADMVLSKPITFDDLQMAMSKALANYVSGVRTLPQPRAKEAEQAAPVPRVLTLMEADIAAGLLDNFSGPEVISLVREYLDDGRRLLRNIIDLHRTGQQAALSGQAHALKGASGFLGFAQVAELAEVIEQGAVDLDCESLDELNTAVQEHFATIEKALVTTP